MKCALSIENLTCSYNGTPVLKDLSLQVAPGEIVCLLGASGCGKTTLLKAMAGLIPLSAGTLSIGCNIMEDGQHSVPPEQRNIGMIFQDYALFPHLTVAENIGFGLTSLAASVRNEKVADMLKLVRLEGLGERYPHQLSGGQQQRVAIARALAYEPDLLLLDEPFSNIDTQVRHDLIEEIRRIFKSQGVTAILVTHSREEAFAFADKLAVMNQGIIEQFGDTTEVYYQPKSRFVADFLGQGSYVPVTVSAQDQMQTPLGPWPRPVHCHPGPHWWLLRPQFLSIRADAQGEGQVLSQQFMGDSSRYTIDIHGQKLSVHAREPLSVGDTVSLTIRPHEPVLFNDGPSFIDA
ncbi:ABC transporter [Salinivibrio proteolyticus]|uniref:ABC transporter ATP-binding protein n=1 Tax=Salinivibrio proteolyticus TaxID=334715 RepID=UPI000989031E|nr:ABC transporter ATP-binding protein [Salinivibrio proteolyticus]OOF26111.1 ABC transporter [Salinivibrio proteolyticus]OOF31486.1 ABC transporter [Salinivibrio proteolyticus]